MQDMRHKKRARFLQQCGTARAVGMARMRVYAVDTKDDKTGEH